MAAPPRLLLALGLLALVALCGAGKDKSHVKVYDQSNFAESIKSPKWQLVEFYGAPPLPHLDDIFLSRLVPVCFFLSKKERLLVGSLISAESCVTARLPPLFPHPPIHTPGAAPWCGHCKQLAPEYEKVAKHFAKQQDKEGAFLDVAIAKVDADAEKELGAQFGVSGFPTLKIFRDGEFVEDYAGGRTWKDMAAAMRVRSKEA